MVFTGLTTEAANQFLSERAEEYVKVDDGYKCKDCEDTIMQTTLFISIHDNRFDVCAGGGEVRCVDYLYCPNCDGDLSDETLRACVHV